MNIAEKAKSILEIDNSNIQTLLVLGVIIAENGQLSGAKEIFNVLKEHIKLLPHVLFNLGQIEYLEGHYE